MALTFGGTTAPSNITQYLDSVFATSLAAYRPKLIDNIGAMNAFLYDLLKGDAYEPEEGGTFFGEDLMYGLSPADWYSGYDSLPETPTDGITQAIYEWRQLASPISYNMREVIQNKNRIINLVESRIKQAELGIQELWSKAFMWGAGISGGNIYTTPTSSVTGASGIEPLGKLVYYGTSNYPTVGNIDTSVTANNWWRNQTQTSAATTYSAFLLELEQMYQKCSLGTGGPPTHILMDQYTYNNFLHAYFAIYKAHPDALDNSYPFIGKKFLNAKVIMDDKVPDAYSNSVGTQVGGIVDPSTLTYGTAYFLNQNFFKIRYQPDRDFTLLKDDNGRAFQKPINGDMRLAHMAWMGNVTCNNRRKQGVLGKLARTYAN